jgi:REP element-mobilizing transposase RayT
VCAVTAPKLSSFYSIAMWRKLKRYYGAGDLHFITCSCYRRQPWLGTPRRRDLFLTVLEQVRKRYQFVVLGYVVMPEHIHLLISEPQEKTPSTRDAGSQTRLCAPRNRGGATTRAIHRAHFSKSARSGAPLVFSVNVERQTRVILSQLKWPTRHPHLFTANVSRRRVYSPQMMATRQNTCSSRHAPV